MADSARLWQWIKDALNSTSPVVLLIVVDSAGSSPGKRGAKMAVTLQGAIGTIGGGAVENGLVKSVRERMVKDMAEPEIHLWEHHESNDGLSSGMVCGGEQTILAFPCQTQDLPFFAQMADCSRLRTAMHLVISKRGLELSPAGGMSFPPHFESGEDWRYSEIIGCRKTAYIIGGGHVSLALSKILDLLDFDIVVIDERQDLETMKINDRAWKKWVAPYAEIDKFIPEGPHVFIIIMTHSHKTDEWVLAKLAEKKVPYLGLLGSRKKIALIKDALSGQLNWEKLPNLHAPVGLPIKSHTPAEIAVSIAAELIEFLNSSGVP
ncbi:MAG: XdhC family protein [Gammaproteobacteria bacterium]